MAEEDGGRLPCFLGDTPGFAHIAENGLALTAGDAPATARGRQIRAGEPLLAQPELLFQDLLGATFEEPSTLRLVHCPRGRSGGCRARRDVLLRVDVGSERARAWAVAATGRCCEEQRTRRLLVFVNPASGSGSAPQSWATAAALWDAVPSLLSCTVVTTTHANDAFERVRALDLSGCDGIVVVSGDGLVHEVWNGLSARADSAAAVRVPIGHIPGGSGNGLAKSILAAGGESYGVLDMAFLIAKGGARPIHLARALQEGLAPRLSFLSLASAAIADIDLSSERLRFLGGLRFTLWAVYRVLRPLRLRLRVRYWPAEAGGEPERPAAGGEWAAPWRSLEDDVSVFWGCNTAWAASDSCPAPGLGMAEPLWRLLLLRGQNVSRWRLLRFFLGLDTGSHVDVPGVELLSCKALRLEPLQEGGLLSLDGEQVPWGPLEIMPSGFEGRVLGR